MRLAAAEPHRFDRLILTGGFFPPSRGGRSLGPAALHYGRHRLAYLRELRARATAPAPSVHALVQLSSVARLGLRPSAFHRLAAAVRCPSWSSMAPTTTSCRSCLPERRPAFIRGGSSVSSRLRSPPSPRRAVPLGGGGHTVLTRPPSITYCDPVTFAVRGEASITTRVATSSGVVNRPVAKPAVA